MEQLLFSLNATIPVFLVMVIGYVLQQLHVTNDSFVKTLNSFNYKITLPVLLFKDMSTADFYSVWDTGYVLFCFFVTLFCIVITWVVAGIFYKNKSRLGELVQASYRSSAAVLGIAFIQNIYGNSGMAPLMIVGTVPLYNIAAVLILSFTGPDAKGFDKESLLKSLKGIITNPIIISIALGMLSSACRIHYPVIISKTISNVAVLATPLALIGLGAGFEGRKALKLLAPRACANYAELSHGAERMSIRYAAQFAPGGLAELLRQRQEEELRAGQSLCGIHREDLELLLDDQPARVYASQGQQRSVVLSLKMAEAAAAAQITGEHPVLLLDDVLSELDEGRKQYLLTCMKEKQTFVTSCDDTDFLKTDGEVYRMDGGVLNRV